MTWLFLVLISASSFSIATLLQRVLLKEEQSDPVAYAVVFQLLVALLVFIYAIVFPGFSLPELKPLIPNLLLMTLLYALPNVTLFKAFQTTEASEITVIGSSRAVWTFISAVIFLKEPFIFNRLIGILLVIIGITALSLRKGKWNLSKGHVFALLSAIFFGFAFTNDAFLLNYFDAPSYTAFAFFLPSVALLIFRPQAINKLKLFFDKKRLLKMLATSFFYGIAALTIYLAYKMGGDASQIVPVGQSSIILTVILAYIFLGEKEYLVNKIIGALLVFAGVIFLK